MFEKLRDNILCCLDYHIAQDFEQLLANIVKTVLNDPYLNGKSIRESIRLSPILKKELQELIASGLVICSNNGFRKKNEK